MSQKMCTFVGQVRLRSVGVAVSCTVSVGVSGCACRVPIAYRAMVCVHAWHASVLDKTCNGISSGQHRYDRHQNQIINLSASSAHTRVQNAEGRAAWRWGGVLALSTAHSKLRTTDADGWCNNVRSELNVTMEKMSQGTLPSTAWNCLL